MTFKRSFRFRALLIGLLSVKIGGTLLLLVGTASVSELLFHQQVAIAQEKEAEKNQIPARGETTKASTSKNTAVARTGRHAREETTTRMATTRG